MNNFTDKISTVMLASNPGNNVAQDLVFLITGGGLMMAIWGIVQLTQSGRQNDSQGKMEATWLILGGILLLAVGGGSMITGVFSNPPGN
jgi:hypothetical protein